MSVIIEKGKTERPKSPVLSELRQLSQQPPVFLVNPKNPQAMNQMFRLLELKYPGYVFFRYKVQGHLTEYTFSNQPIAEGHEKNV